MAWHAAKPTIPATLVFNRNFLLLWAGYFVAAIGDNLNDLGQLNLLGAMAGDESVRLMALMMFGLFLPYIVLGPLAGWCADRFSRKGTMVTADVVRALIVINFATLIPWLVSRGCGAYSVMLTQMMLGMLAAFFSPARQAMVPTLVRPGQLVRANAMISAMAPVGAMLGFTLGGYIVETPWLGVDWNFRINAMTYATSALLVLCVLPPVHRRPAVPQDSIYGPLLEGFAYVRQHRRIMQMILLGAMFWGAAGAVYACVPAVVKEVVSQSYKDVGNYRALPAVGMVLGSAVLTAVGARLGVRPAVLGGLSGAALGLVLLALAFMLRLGGWLVVASLVLIGFAGALLLVTIMATLQRFVPDSRRGRVFGVSDMTTMGAMVLACGLLGLPQIPHMDRYVPAILLLTAALLLGAGGVALRIYARDAARRA